jgi:adenosine kinase
MQLLVSGSLAYDRIMDFPGRFADHILPEKIHNINVCFMVNGLAEKFGGTAGNIAYSLALLGEKPIILATAGKDFKRYRQWLEALGLDCSAIREMADEFTAGAYITTDQANNQITGFNPGAMKWPSGFGFNGIDASRSLAIIAPGNLDDMLSYSRRYKQLGLGYIFDPGQSIPALAADAIVEMIDGARMLITNDYELEMIREKTGLSNGDFLKKCPALITTLGENGSLLSRSGGDIRIGAVKPVQVLDPTGAGDAFRSGILKGLASGADLVTAARLGAACASFAVEHHGTQEHTFDPKTFTARYQETFGPFPPVVKLA